MRGVAGRTLVAAAAGLVCATFASPAVGQEERPITGKIAFLVHQDRPRITVRAHWAWFPLEEYPFDSIGSDDDRVSIHPDLLAAYVNFGCHFEGFVRWDYEEIELEELDDGRIRRRLDLTRAEQGGFYNNESKFRCELATKSRQVNARLGELVTMGRAPAAGFQMGLVQAVWMRMIQAVNRAPRVPGSWGDYLYETFKSILTFNLMDEDTGEVDLYFSPEGDVVEFEISRDRTVILER